MRYMFVKRDQMKVDGFTYGEWRQYVAFLDDAERSAYCVRFSGLPPIMGVIGFTLSMVPLMAAYLAFEGVEVNWPYAFTMLGISSILMIPLLLRLVTSYRLVVKVSGKMLPKDDGSYERDI